MTIVGADMITVLFSAMVAAFGWGCGTLLFNKVYLTAYMVLTPVEEEEETRR